MQSGMPTGVAGRFYGKEMDFSFLNGRSMLF
jgi:hypothetical protein